MDYLFLSTIRGKWSFVFEGSNLLSTVSISDEEADVGDDSDLDLSTQASVTITEVTASNDSCYAPPTPQPTFQDATDMAAASGRPVRSNSLRDAYKNREDARAVVFTRNDDQGCVLSFTLHLSRPRNSFHS